MGAYGYERDTTPNIDRFAGEAVFFETAFSSAPWTLTSHMSMLTGLMPSMHGATRTAHMADTVPYLPELLSGAGYQVDGLVSNAYLSPTFGFDRGFRTYRVRPGDRTNEQIDEALALIRRARGRPQFLFLHLLGPHWPYLPPKDFIGRFGARPRDISGVLDLVLYRRQPGGSEEIQELKDLYDSEVAFVDRELGRFFDELEALGLFETSLIILTSDHGEAFYEHGYWQHSDTLYEEMIRVPLIVKWPGKSQSRNVRLPVSLIDIFPTLAAEAGLSSPANGARDLRLRIESAPPADDHRWVVSEVSWDPDPVRGLVSLFALRSGDLKYIATVESQPDLSGAKILKERLFDLSRDPSESVDLTASGDVDLEAFRRGLLDYLSASRQFRAGHRGTSVTLDDVTRERLKSLGYIEE
jgi:arylsulfatase A-like enzyme